MNNLISAGLLMYRIKNKKIEYFLAHPGGPFFSKKNEGVWTIPKGKIEENESLLEAAKREFEEETGIEPTGEFISIESIIQKGGKTVYCWAFEKDVGNHFELKSNRFEIELPPKSKNYVSFPELDKAGYFSIEEAEKKINKRQKEFLYRLKNHLNKTTTS